MEALAAQLAVAMATYGAGDNRDGPNHHFAVLPFTVTHLKSTAHLLQVHQHFLVVSQQHFNRRRHISWESIYIFSGQ